MEGKRIGNKVIRAALADITDMELEAFVFDITADAMEKAIRALSVTESP